MTSALTIIFFLFGLIVGSFLNVVILRLNTHKSFGGRSACMSCQKQLYWYDLVPLFSFCALLGRCRNCKSKISIQYPFVEFVTGLIFAGLFLKFELIFNIDIISFALSYAYYSAMFSLLIVIAVYDIKHKIIPDTLSLFFGVLAFVGLFFFDPFFGLNVHVPSYLDFLAGLVVSVPFAFFWFISKGRWMGLGDAKLAIGIGFLLGFSGMIEATVFSFWTGALFGLILMATRKVHGLKSEIPFAPFLVFGAFLVFICELGIYNFQF